MNILGREFITEQMPDGWVICERIIDGVLGIVGNTCSTRKQAATKLNTLNDCLVSDCQKQGLTPEQYWQNCECRNLSRLVSLL